MYTKTNWRRFPSHLLASGTTKEFIYAHSGSIGCDHAFLALPTLAMLGSAIGTRRCLQLKNGWREYPVVWSMIVGESGTKKSPAARAAIEPLEVNDPRTVEEYVCRVCSGCGDAIAVGTRDSVFNLTHFFERDALMPTKPKSKKNKNLGEFC